MTNWHREAIPDSVAKTLSEVAPLEPMSDFYLAGGTGLAVHFGHRRSVVLDLFSAPHSDEQRWLAVSWDEIKRYFTRVATESL
jgi:hypothetical protein